MLFSDNWTCRKRNVPDVHIAATASASVQTSNQLHELCLVGWGLPAAARAPAPFNNPLAPPALFAITANFAANRNHPYSNCPANELDTSGQVLHQRDQYACVHMTITCSCSGQLCQFRQLFAKQISCCTCSSNSDQIDYVEVHELSRKKHKGEKLIKSQKFYRS